MWKCAGCGEEIEPAFDHCWACGTGRDGSPAPPEFQAIGSSPAADVAGLGVPVPGLGGGSSFDLLLPGGPGMPRIGGQKPAQWQSVQELVRARYHRLKRGAAACTVAAYLGLLGGVAGIVATIVLVAQPAALACGVFLFCEGVVGFFLLRGCGAAMESLVEIDKFNRVSAVRLARSKRGAAAPPGTLPT